MWRWGHTPRYSKTHHYPRPTRVLTRGQGSNLIEGITVRKYLLAAAAAAAIATPAAARDHSAYVGIDGGILFPSNKNLNINASGTGYVGYYLNYYTGSYSADFRTHYKRGYD